MRRVKAGGHQKPGPRCSPGFGFNIVSVLAYCAMAGVAFMGGQYYVRAAHLQRRLAAAADRGDSGSAAGSIARMVVRHFDEKRFGVDDTLRDKLRLNLVRAGYFRKDAINFYVFWRMASVVLLPIIAYFALLVSPTQMSPAARVIIIVVATGLGIIGPDAFIARRQRRLSYGISQHFSRCSRFGGGCVDAGLSIEGALDRVKLCAEFGDGMKG
jgi:tight adherence protein C